MILRSTKGLAAFVGYALLASGGMLAPRSARAAGGAHYRQVQTWPDLPPDVALGEVAGVAVDGYGHVLVFHRPGRGFDPQATEKLHEPAVLELDASTGRSIGSWGADTFLVPHGIAVDGANNVFLTDVGLQQVFKFTHDGRLLLALGEALVGGWDGSHFHQPTDVAILPDGSFYVSDGYVNSRVAYFDPNGKELCEWGKKGSGPGEFDNPHGLALLKASGGLEVLVADRQNARLQVFDPGGKFERQWRGATDAHTTGRVFSVAADDAGALYLGIRRDDYDSRHTGVVRLDREGEVVAAIGFGNPGDPEFQAVHDVAVGPDGSIYVAETRTKRVWKLRPAE